MRKTAIFLLVIAAGLAAAFNQAWASVCAEVQIEVRQEVSLERQAFDAHMRINNGLAGSTLEQVNRGLWGQACKVAKFASSGDIQDK